MGIVKMSTLRCLVHLFDFLPLYFFFSPLCLNCFFLLMMLFTSLLWSHLSRSTSHLICLTSVRRKMRSEKLMDTSVHYVEYG